MSKKTFTNYDDGIQAIITKGNDKFAYRVIMRDLDSDAVVYVKLTNNFSRAEKYALEFINGAECAQ